MLLVLAVAGALVYPDLQPLLRGTEREAALRRVRSFLDDVRTRAVAEGSTLSVEADGEDRRLVVHAEGEGEGELLSHPFPPECPEVTLAPDRIRYFPAGHSSGGTLTLRCGARPPVRIMISAFTGLSRTAEGETGG